MIKQAIFGAIILALLALPSQGKSEPKMAVGISATSVILGGLHAVYQVKLTESMMLTLPAGVSYDWLKIGLVARNSFTRMPLSFFAGVGTKFLVYKPKHASNFYIEPRITANYSQFGFLDSSRPKLYDSVAWSLVPKLNAGFDWHFANNFFMSLGGGLGMNIYVKKNDAKLPKQTDFPDKKWAFPPRGRIVSLALDGELMLGMSW